jgi:hypothetical protein
VALMREGNSDEYWQPYSAPRAQKR